PGASANLAFEAGSEDRKDQSAFRFRPQKGAGPETVVPSGSSWPAPGPHHPEHVRSAPDPDTSVPRWQWPVSDPTPASSRDDPPESFHGRRNPEPSLPKKSP